MKRSSLIALIVGAVLLIYLATVVFSFRAASMPEMKREDATQYLDRLAKAFDSSSTEGVLAFAAPDAKVAGRELEDIRQLLHRAFAAIKDPHVDFKNLTFEKRDQTTVYLRFDAKVIDKSPAGYAAGGELYSQRMGFTVKRIEVPKLGGLLHTYEWRISDVDAPHLPDSTGVPGL